MYFHNLPLKLPEEFARDPGKPVSISNKGPSKTEIPRSNPKSSDDTRDAQTDFYDAFFFGQLFSLYQSGAFPRGNLDAGRINALLERGVIEFVDSEPDPVDPSVCFRLNAEAGFSLFSRLEGSPAHRGFE